MPGALQVRPGGPYGNLMNPWVTQSCRQGDLGTALKEQQQNARLGNLL